MSTEREERDQRDQDAPGDAPADAPSADADAPSAAPTFVYSEKHCSFLMADGRRCRGIRMKDGSGLCPGHAGLIGHGKHPTKAATPLQRKLRAAAGGGGDGAVVGDLGTARQAFLDVIANKKSPQAAIVAAARGLADLESKMTVERLPSAVRQVQALTTEGLHDLIRRLQQEKPGAALLDVSDGPEEE